jgi:hypothetical protein
MSQDPPDPGRGVRGFLAQVVRDAGRGENRQVSVSLQSIHDCRHIDVVAMFVGDQHGVSTGQGFRGFGKCSRVQHQDPAVLLEADAGVGVFRQLHSASLGSGPDRVHEAPAGNLDLCHHP